MSSFSGNNNKENTSSNSNYSTTAAPTGSSSTSSPLTEWRAAVSDDGRTYYWNIRTKQVQWVKPSEQ